MGDMERQLLLLGLLRMQEMHGYQINEFIESHLGESIQLKKPTVYKLLATMQQDGWITSREQKEGNYPTRRVFAIAPGGESEFQKLLRQNLSQYSAASYLGNIGIMFVDALETKEACTLLSERRQRVFDSVMLLEEHAFKAGGFDLMLSYNRHVLQAELDWLDEVVDKLASQIQPPDGHIPN